MFTFSSFFYQKVSNQFSNFIIYWATDFHNSFNVRFWIGIIIFHNVDVNVAFEVWLDL